MEEVVSQRRRALTGNGRLDALGSITSGTGATIGPSLGQVDPVASIAAMASVPTGAVAAAPDGMGKDVTVTTKVTAAAE